MSKKTIYNRLQKEIRQDPKWIEMMEALSTVLEHYDYLPSYFESRLDECKKFIIEGARDRVLEKVKEFPLEDPATTEADIEFIEKVFLAQKK